MDNVGRREQKSISRNPIQTRWKSGVETTLQNLKIGGKTVLKFAHVFTWAYLRYLVPNIA